MTIKIQGRFPSHTIATRPKKDGTGDTTYGDMLVVIDNSWTNRDGETILAEDIVPFVVFGRQAEEAACYLTGQLVEITCVLQGNLYNGRTYPRIRAIAVRNAEMGRAAPSRDAPIERPAPNYGGNSPDDEVPF